MTSDAQKQANRKNAQHSTGPTTPKGLSISSQNARKHGANAEHLVNPDEIAQYDTLIERLKERYSSDNPLVEMQLARIAKLNVQLTRIQNLIDASFTLAMDHSMTDDILMDSLKMSDSEKIDARQIISNNSEAGTVFDLDLIKIIAEVGQLDPETLKTQQDFLKYTPLFCQYLYDQASRLDVSIRVYISTYLKTQQSSLGTNPLIDKLFRDYIKLRQDKTRLEKENQALKQGLVDDRQQPPKAAAHTKEDAIVELRVNELHEACKSIKDIIHNKFQTNHKLYAFTQIRKVEHNPLALEYDNLDKLFRYQTSIQRQLSSALGELIYLNKS